jgi:kynurenine formamidase
MPNESVSPDGKRSFAEVGAVSRLGPAEVVRALATVRQGRVFDLEVERFPRMPGHAAHPALQVLTYRSPPGERIEAGPGWEGKPNPHGLGFITDLVIAGTHTGTHIDALSHFTVGPDDSWFNGEAAATYLSDFGPTRHDAASLPPIITRGVLLDVPAALGRAVLPPGHVITTDDCRRALDLAGLEIAPGDAVLIRTGYMTGWPDERELERSAGAGVGLAAARWLADAGAVVMGTDNPGFEPASSEDPERPRTVHPLLLVERGIPILELLYLEELARERVHSFALVISPLKIRGTTASMIRPLALI